MINLRAQPPTVELSSGDITVQFVWESDRYVHRILVSGEAVAVSIEGDADQDFPPSPPLQQISLENLGGRDVVLGVGAAGRGHWSVSVEPLQDDQGNPGIKFDWACRITDAQPELGTTYTTSSTKLSFEVDSKTSINTNPTQTRLHPASPANGSTHQWKYHVATRVRPTNR